MDTTHSSLLVRLRDPQDAAAWREFCAIYRPMLIRFARSCGLPEEDAEDVTQYCMAAVLRNIRTFKYDRRKGRFKGWLRTMVNNRVRNVIRARREQLAESGDFKRAQAREQSPEDRFDEIWLDEHLRYCIGLVQEEIEASTFEAFRLYALEERSVDEVCRDLDLTPNQLYKIKWRVTQKIGEKMKALVEGEA
jgi:RNA polymerase sigma-70 factor (ECF subfamily)